MLNKLTIRNVRRSARDYLIYLVTMTIVSALMFAFNGMMFSEDMRRLSSMITIFIVLTAMVSVFIVMIIIWLVHYIVNFMLERRSREFGIYLLLGMTKKQIRKIFWRENVLLGILSMVLGLVPGYFFQVIFTNVFYSLFDMEYQISAEFSLSGILITIGIMLFAYWLALFRVKRKLKKMNIRDLVSADQQNQKIINENKTWKKWFAFIAAAYIIFFHVLVFMGQMTLTSVWFYIAGFVAAIYLLYAGLSAVFVSYIRKKSKGVYKDSNLFIFRQLSSKVKTMRFTMGTLTVLFTTALLGWMVVMMFADAQKNVEMPFDVIVFSDRPDDDFEKVQGVLSVNVKVKKTLIYRIFENETAPMNDYLYRHVDGTWRDEKRQDLGWEGSSYFGYDTYIGLGDYNKVRRLLGYEPVTLSEGHYLLHGKERLSGVFADAVKQVEIKAGDKVLAYQDTYMEPLSQDGMNGADYLLVVPDQELEQLTPYYSLLAAKTTGKVPENLQSKIEAVQDFQEGESEETLYRIEWGSGSNQVLSYSGPAIVAENAYHEGNFVIMSLCFVLAYIGVVFLCAALTVLTIQQLSDASKYRFRYTILKKLGLSRKETEKVVLKQLGVYYLCPFLISVVLSMFIGLLGSERFVYYTGVHAGVFQYYILAVLVFAILYAAYFITAYIGFLRNLERGLKKA